MYPRIGYPFSEMEIKTWINNYIIKYAKSANHGELTLQHTYNLMLAKSNNISKMSEKIHLIPITGTRILLKYRVYDCIIV